MEDGLWGVCLVKENEFDVPAVDLDVCRGCRSSTDLPGGLGHDANFGSGQAIVVVRAGKTYIVLI